MGCLRRTEGDTEVEDEASSEDLENGLSVPKFDAGGLN